MKRAKIANSNISIDDFKNTKIKSYELKNMQKLKKNLNIIKTELDDIYANHSLAHRIMKSFDPFNNTKYQLAKSKNTFNITVAWLKGYELLYQFNLIPQTADKFVYFDNAAFPGSFILAAHHIVNTLCNITNFKWYASSLLSDNGNSKKYNPLDDSYSLYKNYPNNWLMNDENNGDITKWDNIMNFQNQLKDKEGEDRTINLYSCDLGVDVSSNYNEQEKIHFHLNICQIVCGLKVLAPNGDMMIKHYTMFEDFTISYIALLTELFSDVYITKPVSSKRTNSETYIVCKTFLYPFKKDTVQQYIYDLFMDRAKTNDYSPLISSQCISKSIESIQCIMSKIFLLQIDSLKKYIYSVKNIRDPMTNERCRIALNQDKNLIRQQFLKMSILPINNQKKLNMKKKY